MKRLCECGRPALALGRVRKKSSARTKARQPVAMFQHSLCQRCMKRMVQSHWARILKERQVS